MSSPHQELESKFQLQSQPPKAFIFGFISVEEFGEGVVRSYVNKSAFPTIVTKAAQPAPCTINDSLLWLM